ncbi:MAG TPA: FAD-dependent oxidoreductase [Bauldia sp.]|nr:FAD-dependent oxidoreductase [Bauldia sp.]
MADELTPDICVIGGGPGGIAAATAAAASGTSVVLVEKDRTGGHNLTSGTVPAKALVAAASVYESIRAGRAFGVTGAPLQVDFGRLRQHIEEAIAAVARNTSAERLTAQGVKVIAGSARFANPDLVAVDNTTIRARRVIIATGAIPAMPQIPGLDTVEAMTMVDGFALNRRPTHLIVLGANRYALEFAQAYARIGIDTTVIDEAPALPDVDPEMATVVLDRLRAEGIRVRAGIKIGEIARRRGGVRVTLTDAAEGEINVDGSHILVAAGRWPDVEGLGLAAAGIEWSTGGITVDRYLRTTNRRVYAIGDVIAGPPLAARAEIQAAGVVRAILYRVPVRDDTANVPAVAYTDPGLASVGLDEAAARLHHRDIRILRMPFAESDRAQMEREPAGMLKVIATAGGGRVLGAAMVGRNAAELIAPWSMAVANRLSLATMAAHVAPYPSRAALNTRVAAALNPAAARAGLTPAWQRSIITLFRKLG